MTDTQPEPAPTTRSSRPLVIRLLIALVITLIVTGYAFWSGYSTLRGPRGWVGERRFVTFCMFSIQENLTKYHEEHGAYPETLQEIYGSGQVKSDNEQTDEEAIIEVQGFPVFYERTDGGWRITYYGHDRKPGGVGVDADLVYTSEMSEDELHRELSGRKYHATFEQVQTVYNGTYFRKLITTSLVLGVLVFAVIISGLSSLKKEHISATIVSMVLITIAAIWFGGGIMMAHNIATGH